MSFKDPTGAAKGHPPVFQEEVACERCGRFGAVEMGDQRLCPDCLQTACSCCPEFDAEADE
jgi:hypothetical protein